MYKDILYNIPYFFFYWTFTENFDSQMNKIKINQNQIFNGYLKDNEVKLISTIAFVYNLDEKLENKLFLLNFKHNTRKIDFYIDYYSYKLEILKKLSANKYKSLKLIIIIKHILKNKHKNIFEYETKDSVKLRHENKTNYFNVQLSITVLNNIHNNGKVNNIFNSSKLFKLSQNYLNDLSIKSNIHLSLVDLNKKCLPFFLKDILIIYRNK